MTVKKVIQANIDNQLVILVPKQEHNRSKLILIVMVATKYVNGVPTLRLFTALVNSGSTGCLFNRCALPYGAETSISAGSILHITTQGIHTCIKVVYLDDIVLPKFINNRLIKDISCHVC